MDRARTRCRAQRRRDARRRSGGESAHRSLAGGRAALAIIPLAFGSGALAARLWLRQAPSSLGPDLTQPLPVVSAWGDYGAASLTILAGAIFVSTLALIVGGMRPEGRPQRRDVTFVLVATALSLGACLAWPFVFSSDVYAYAAYGDMSLQGLDPFRLVPSGLHDALIDAARVQWGGAFPVCVYGPGFVALARLAVTFTQGHGVAATLFGLRAVACATFLASVATLNVALAGCPPGRRHTALCAYGLNPMLIWTAAEGHNDTYVSLAACGAAVLLQRRRGLAAVFMLALTPILKASGDVLAVAAMLEAALVTRLGKARSLLALAAGSGIALGVALPPLLPALAAVGARGRYEPASVQGIVGLWPAAALSLAAAAYACAQLAGRQRTGFAWFGVAVILALPNVYPWYGLWLAPLALAAGGGFAAAAVWGATISSGLRYLPDATGQLTGATRFAAALGSLPLALALAQFAPRQKKESAQP